ncbi:MAG: hypothetical protein GPOALKHO_000625 [Sodalis sp.]|nr:MAG: hypothetical protein GPOALKHO_000625 [Sodalis sp.]
MMRSWATENAVAVINSSKLKAQRYTALVKKNGVSRQDTDDGRDHLATKRCFGGPIPRRGIERAYRSATHHN